jgi:hypothetical protein
MFSGLARKVKRTLWKSVLGEPSWIAANEDFRTREHYGLINRANYAYGMLRAADCANYFGQTSVTVVEMGVASGGGLLNMIEVADQIRTETGVSFNIFGFDTGIGLPSVQGHKDHPEIWNPGDFEIEARESLEKKLKGYASIIWGDIDQTIDDFTTTLDPRAPLGFISIDVDIYTATKAGLRCFNGSPEKYLPAVSMYFDDVRFFFANKWCGELAAIEEFNSSSEFRKIDIDRSVSMRPAQSWHPSMYACHILDHPSRQRSRSRTELTIGDHAKLMISQHLF